MNMESFLKSTIENETQKEVIRILREENAELKKYCEKLELKLSESIKLSGEMLNLINELKIELDFNKTT